MTERAYTDNALRVTRPLMRLAITGAATRSDAQDRDVHLQMAEKISAFTCDREMREALEELEASANSGDGIPGMCRGWVLGIVSPVLDQVRHKGSNLVDPHRALGIDPDATKPAPPPTRVIVEGRRIGPAPKPCFKTTALVSAIGATAFILFIAFAQTLIDNVDREPAAVETSQ